MTDTIDHPSPPASVEIEPPPKPVPLQRQGRIETDTFCEHCGYNLHSQPVTLDERLGIRVARCPECGHFIAAGRATSAASLWLSRVATLALAFWVLVILFAIVWLCIGLGAVQVVHVEEFSHHRMVADDGREVVWTNVPGAGSMSVYKGTTQPAGAVRHVRVAGMRPVQNAQDAKWRREQFIIGSIILTLSDIGLGVVAGVLLVTIFWHWKRGRYRFVLLLPFAVAAVVLAVMFVDDAYAEIHGWMTSRVLMHAAIQATFLWLGILMGRPMMRGVLRMFIPSRPRQVFAFLWHADGKAMPPAAVPAPK